MGDIADYYGAYIPSYDEDLSELEDNELVALTSKSLKGLYRVLESTMKKGENYLANKGHVL